MFHRVYLLRPMELLEYLRREKLTLAKFAHLIGRSKPTISRIARGLNQPDWQTMNAIEKATAGAVTPNDFRTKPAAKPRRKQPTEGAAA